MTLQEVRKVLKEDCERSGCQAAWGMKHGISPGYVSDVLVGRRKPGRAILKALGIERVVTYVWENEGGV